MDLDATVIWLGHLTMTGAIVGACISLFVFALSRNGYAGWAFVIFMGVILINLFLTSL